MFTGEERHVGELFKDKLLQSVDRNSVSPRPPHMGLLKSKPSLLRCWHYLEISDKNLPTQEHGMRLRHRII